MKFYNVTDSGLYLEETEANSIKTYDMNVQEGQELITQGELIRQRYYEAQLVLLKHALDARSLTIEFMCIRDVHGQHFQMGSFIVMNQHDFCVMECINHIRASIHPNDDKEIKLLAFKADCAAQLIEYFEDHPDIEWNNDRNEPTTTTITTNNNNQNCAKILEIN